MFKWTIPNFQNEIRDETDQSNTISLRLTTGYSPAYMSYNGMTTAAEMEDPMEFIWRFGKAVYLYLFQDGMCQYYTVY